MPAEIVKTDVDALINTVKKKKEVSVPDIAKELNIDQKTVESWASFLEEEGIVSIKYKFTTPYIVYKEVKEVKPVKPEIAHPPVPPKKAKKKVEEKITDLNKLLVRAYEHLKKGDFKEARKIYLGIRNQYEKLPSVFTERKNELINDLTKLDKKISENFGAYLSKEVDEKSKKIYSLIKSAEKSVNENKIQEAAAFYSEAEKIFNTLPTGFMERKRFLQSHLIALDQKLISRRTEEAVEKLRSNAMKITEFLSESKKFVEKKDINKLTRIYDNIQKLYSELPEGFMQAKKDLQEKIFELDRDIVNLKIELTLKETDTKAKEIKNLLKEVNRRIKEKRIDEAEAVLNKAKRIYRSLPEGFLERRIELEKQLLYTEKRFTAKKTELAFTEMVKKKKKILKLVNTAERYLKKDKIDLAAELYSEILIIYNALPKGFLDEKTKLQTRLLELYKNSVIKSDIMFLKQVDEKIKARYGELLKLIIRIKQHIEKCQFEEMEKNYIYINRLYEELPIGFLRRKLKIYDEIVKIYKEIKLYRAVKELDKLMSERSFGKLRDVFEQILREYEKIPAELVEEDRELFNYIKNKLDTTRYIIKGYEAEARRKIIEEFKKPKKEKTEQELYLEAIDKEITKRLESLKKKPTLSEVETVEEEVIENIKKKQELKKFEDAGKKEEEETEKRKKELKRLEKEKTKEKKERIREEAERREEERKDEKRKKEERRFREEEERIKKEKIKEEERLKEEEEKLKREERKAIEEARILAEERKKFEEEKEAKKRDELKKIKERWKIIEEIRESEERKKAKKTEEERRIRLEQAKIEAAKEAAALEKEHAEFEMQKLREKRERRRGEEEKKAELKELEAEHKREEEKRKREEERLKEEEEKLKREERKAIEEARILAEERKKFEEERKAEQKVFTKKIEEEKEYLLDLVPMDKVNELFEKAREFSAQGRLSEANKIYEEIEKLMC